MAEHFPYLLLKCGIPCWRIGVLVYLLNLSVKIISYIKYNSIVRALLKVSGDEIDMIDDIPRC